MKKIKSHQFNVMKAACAGLCATTRGKARTFADKRALLPGIISASMDDEISEGLAEYAELKEKQAS